MIQNAQNDDRAHRLKIITTAISIIAFVSAGVAALSQFILFVSLSYLAQYLFQSWLFWLTVLAILSLLAAAIITMMFINKPFNPITTPLVLVSGVLCVLLNFVLFIITSIDVNALIGSINTILVFIYLLSYVGYIFGGLSAAGLCVLSIMRHMQHQKEGGYGVGAPQSNQGFQP